MPLKSSMRALEIIKEQKIIPKTQIVEIYDALDRTIALDILSPFDQPLYNKSLMDGYAYSSKGNTTKIVGSQKAGQKNSGGYSKNQCIKIMTGAIVPKEFDRVVRIEYTKHDSGFMEIVQKETGNNICYQGEYLKKGQKIISKGKLLDPQTIGILASLGIASVLVYQKPIVGIIVTGDELLDVSNKIAPGKKYNSNLIMLSCQIKKAGAIPKHYGILKDNLLDTQNAIKKALLECDIVISSGGASMGDYDFIPRALKNLQARFLFQKIAFKPGKPTFFAHLHNKYYFALPGNPVSSFVVFEIFVKPFVYKYLNSSSPQKILHFRMGEKYHRKKDLDRLELRPIKIINNKIDPLEFKNSGHLSALYDIDGFLQIDKGVKILPKDSWQKVVLNYI